MSFEGTKKLQCHQQGQMENARLVRLNKNRETTNGTLTLLIHQLGRMVNICNCVIAVTCRHLVEKGKMCQIQ